MGCFARSTPLEVMHEALKAGYETGSFDVHDWLDAQNEVSLQW